jgi:hypothetical protein
VIIALSDLLHPDPRRLSWPPGAGDPSVTHVLPSVSMCDWTDSFTLRHVQLVVNGMLQVIGGLVLAAPASCEFTSVAALRLVNVGNVYSPLFM